MQLLKSLFSRKFNLSLKNIRWCFCAVWRLAVWIVGDCGLLSCPVTPNLMRGRTLTQPLKPQCFIPLVCALHEQCTHHRRSVKMSNLQILLKIPIVRGWFFFQRVKIPYARGRARSISKSQGGLPRGMHWRKRDCKIRYWRTGTVYEAYLFGVSNHTLVTP